MTRYFEYGEEEICYLKSRDPKLAEAIQRIGPIQREMIPDLFEALVHSIVGQQITTKAQQTIWKRIKSSTRVLTPDGVLGIKDDELQSFGLSYRKVSYIKSAAQKIQNGMLDIEALQHMSDQEVCESLVTFQGIGQWTAEMLMIFSMGRPNILSYGDLAIQRGLRMLYHHRKITPQLFRKYKNRYTPFATVASLYLWAIAGGAIEGMKDYAPKKK